MLPGISGSLIASALLEEALVDELRREPDLATRSRLAAAHRWWRRAERALGPASATRAVLDVAVLPLLHLLDYELLHVEPVAGGFVGLAGRAGHPLAVFRTTSWNGDAGAAWRDTVRASRTAGARWGLICTGRRVRLIDAARTWSRRALDFDVPSVLADERSATALLALLNAFTLEDARGQSRLEHYVARSDAHATAVCASLGDGVLEGLTALVAALDRPTGRRASAGSARELFERALTIVYRLLFLLYAEARSIVPVWHRVYRDAYSIETLWRRSLHDPNARGLWASLSAIVRLAHAGCRAGDLVVTPFNGRLFAPSPTQGHDVRLPDAAVRRALLALATTPTPAGRRRIAYADLGVEQLGAVYESVLEYEPAPAPAADPGRGRAPLVITRTSDERKATASFYTPRVLTDFLVRRTLHPLVDGQPADRIVALRVVDPAMGSGAVLVAACRYLAAALERALAAEGRWTDDDHLGARRAELRRTVAQRCLFGVDRNPMAVQLARLSLWLCTLAGDRPLTFLDHHLVTGDSLIGARLLDLARGWPNARARARPDERLLPLFLDDAAEQMASHVLPERFRLATAADDSPSIVRAKEGALAALAAPGTPLARWKAAASVWCAAWFGGGAPLNSAVYADVCAFLLGRGAALSLRHREPVLARASALAADHAFFHWELEFPEVFFDDHGRRRDAGGFDAVIGNPPWDVMRADSGTREARERARTARAGSFDFFRRSGVYGRRGTGHLNQYQLFVDRACQIARRGGRLGLILPSGLATDQGSAPLRRALLDTTRIDRVIGFDNRRGIFPIHRDVKFLLVTATCGERTDALIGAFGCSEADWLDTLPDHVREDPPEARRIVIARSLLESWDREHLSWPLLGSAVDLEILAHTCASCPRLGAADGWNARFGRELNATDDKRHFVSMKPPSASDDREWLPVVDGKHLTPFRVRLAAVDRRIAAATASSLIARDGSTRPRLAYRDVASATNRLTLIAALLPAHVVSTHTVFCLKPPLGLDSQYCLLALLNSLVANYLVRLHVTTHVTTAVMARLPIPRPPSRSPAFRELVALARVLEQKGLDDAASYARLNAIAAQLYQLTAPQYRHIVSTFPLLPASLREQCVHAAGGQF